MFSPYKISQPTSLQPATVYQNGQITTWGGWVPNSRVVFEIPVDAGFEIRKGSIRIGGLIQFLKADGVTPTAPEDLVSLNPNAGVSSVFRQIQSSIDGRILEVINEYPRLISASNEASWFQVDEATTTDSMLEIMTHPSDDFQDPANPYVKNIVCQGVQFPTDDGASEVPFSVDLDVCLNKSHLPSSKVRKAELSINLQDANKALYSPVAGASYTYALKNLQVRYIVDPERKTKDPVIMEVKSNSYVGSVMNQVSTLTHSVSHPFDKMWVVFLKEGWDNTSTDFTKDYLLTHAIMEEVNFCEFKLNGQSNLVKYPLRFKETEMSTLYLNAQQKDEEAVSLRHGLTYGKLASTVQKTGYGLGSPLSQMMPPSTQVQINLNLKTPPTNIYRAFFYARGLIEL